AGISPYPSTPQSSSSTTKRLINSPSPSEGAVRPNAGLPSPVVQTNCPVIHVEICISDNIAESYGNNKSRIIRCTGEGADIASASTAALSREYFHASDAVVIRKMEEYSSSIPMEWQCPTGGGGSIEHRAVAVL
ncbi:hypothetical protein FOZ63_014042, partial [Perkinsus olseni]